jgi:hypothetical protein
MLASCSRSTCTLTAPQTNSCKVHPSPQACNSTLTCSTLKQESIQTTARAETILKERINLLVHTLSGYATPHLLHPQARHASPRHQNVPHSWQHALRAPVTYAVAAAPAPHSALLLTQRAVAAARLAICWLVVFWSDQPALLIFISAPAVHLTVGIEGEAVPAADSGLHDLDATQAFHRCWFALEGSVTMAQSPSDWRNTTASNSDAGFSVVHAPGATPATHPCKHRGGHACWSTA